MLMAGKAEYSKFDGYYELNCNMAVDSADIDCTELRFAKNSAGDYVAFFAAKKVPGLFKAEEYKENDLFYLIFHKGEYEIYDSASKSRIKTQPSPYETLVHRYLDADGASMLEGVYSGTLCIQPSASTLKLVEQQSAWNVLFSLTALEESTLLKESSEKAARGKGGYGGQSEAQKLLDRKAFLLAQLGIDPNLTIIEALPIMQGDGIKVSKAPIGEVAFEIINALIV
jgi:hypothetical protein